MHNAKIILYSAWILIVGICTCLRQQDDLSRRYSSYGTNDGKDFKDFFSGSGGGYLMARSTDTQLNLSDPIDANLSNLLDINGPDMRPCRGYKEKQMISMNVSKRAWTLLRSQAIGATEVLTRAAEPSIHDLLIRANVSRGCNHSIKQVFDGAKRFESWAIKLLTSWGSFPTNGMFEGTYSEVGSFHTCVNIPENRYIGHAHYCSITFRPVMPTKKDYELVVRKERDELLNMFAKDQNDTSEFIVRDAFHDLLEHSQYYHLLYYKIGTCWPIQCSPFDVRRIAKVIGRMNIFLRGPVKCYSLNSSDYEQPDTVTNSSQILEISVWDKNGGLYIWKPYFNDGQKAASAVLVIITSFIAIMTLIDLFGNYLPVLSEMLSYALRNFNQEEEEEINEIKQDENSAKSNLPSSLPLSNIKTQLQETTFTATSSQQRAHLRNIARGHDKEPSFWMELVKDCSIITNAPQFFRVSQNHMKNDILCLNGIRCITMTWVVLAHTMAFNDWSAFSRTRDVELSIKSPISQPLFNGSYLVDTFFLMSGLLSAYTAFKYCQGARAKFNSFAFLFGRWLRLTPQIFFVSMMYIVMPAISYGPHWYPIVGEFSENCIDNWWVNVLHIQSFVRQEKMCNFVTWWISVDFFHHFLAVVIILVLLNAGHQMGLYIMSFMVLSQVSYQAIEHFRLELPPNFLSTIPQTGAMWSVMTLKFFWTPYTHSVPFFSGFYIGYLIVLKEKLVARLLNPRVALIGWTLSVSLLLTQSYSTFWWVIGAAGYTKVVSTSFYVISTIVWSSSICWIIIACHFGYGGIINSILSWKPFVILGKASYLVYLTHFQIMFLYFGNQSLLLEPTPLNMLYIITGNILLSTLLGIFLCVVFELPWLKAQRRLMKYV